MTQSMTGYGKAEINLDNTNFTIELKSLNSKQIDINVKLPSIYRDKEIEIRKLLSEKLQRGKVELSIWRAKSESFSKYHINTSVVKNYHNQLLTLKQELEFKEADIIPALLKMPDVLIKEVEQADEDHWDVIQCGIHSAITDLLAFRLDEGEKLEQDIKLRIKKISKLLKDISPFEKARIKKIKKTLSEKLAAIDGINIDDKRFEQELIYYLEKQDITEEKVRLAAHLQHFTDSMKTTSPNGKKLAFITQEIGREINTIGSKSSDVNMQKTVVEMKDELEKIKEQLLNIL